MSERRRGTGWGYATLVGCAYTLGLVACSGKVGDESLKQADRALGVEEGSGTSESASSNAQSASSPAEAASGSAASASATAESGSGVVAGNGGVAVSTESALHTGADCEQLLEQFQANLLAQVQQRAEEARQQRQYYLPTPEVDTGVPVTSVDVAPISVGSNASSAASSGAIGFSGTTLQVPGVDEADFVKTEGDRIYLLHGPKLYVLRADSIDSTEILSSITIEGEAVDLFVHEGKVAVFSRLSGTVPGADASTYQYYYYYYPYYTKLTVLDAASGTPEVLRESYVEGNYASSRRHDAVVRAIVQQSSKAQLDYPNVVYVDFLGHPYSEEEVDLQVDLWVSLATDSILDSVIDDYLPSEFELANGALVKQALRCSDYLLPGAALTQAGSSSVVTLDLDAPTDPLRHTTVLGVAEGVYANTDVVLFTQTEYRYGAEQASAQTNIHRFDIDGVNTTYSASGTFSGYIQGQFSLDELDGVIRVSTTENTFLTAPLPVEGDAAVPVPPPVSRVLTLGKDGNRLVELGRTPDFGANEQVYATRFLGDRGYVVTYRQIDPLFVVDLADPAAPKIAGALHLPGYSNFLYPMPDHHLLAIGQEADSNGLELGLALKIFDVRDANAPSLAHSYTFADQGYTEASYNPRAFSFNADQDLVSFPFQNYVTGQTTLEVLSVSATDGIVRLGGIVPESRDLSLRECLILQGYPDDPSYLESLVSDPETLAYYTENCRYYGTASARRGLFHGSDDDVYAISTLNVAAYALDGLDGPPSSKVDLPATYPYYYYSSGPSIPIESSGAGGGASTGEAGSGSGLGTSEPPLQDPELGAPSELAPGAGGAASE